MTELVPLDQPAAETGIDYPPSKIVLTVDECVDLIYDRAHTFGLKYATVKAGIRKIRRDCARATIPNYLWRAVEAHVVFQGGWSDGRESGRVEQPKRSKLKRGKRRGRRTGERGA